MQRWPVVTLLLLTAGACGRSVAVEDQGSDDAPEERPPYPIHEALCHFLGRCKPELLAGFASDSEDECTTWVACKAEQAADLRDELEDAAGCLEFVENAACTDIDAVFWPGVGDFIFAGVDFQLYDACPYKPIVGPGRGRVQLSHAEQPFRVRRHIVLRAGHTCKARRAFTLRNLLPALG